MKKYFKYYVLALLVISANACTDLEENMYDTIVTDEFYGNKNEVLSAVLRPYTHASAWITSSGQVGWWRVSELSADQLAWPVKGIHGQDGFQWVRLHYHTWTEDDDVVWGPWRLMWWGLGLCTDPIDNLEKRSIEQMGITEAEKAAFIGELKLLRALHYLKIMDLWGNVPIPASIGEVSPKTRSRAEVFAYIEKEILDNINNVPPLSAAMAGRMSQAGGYAMLVELYLNAEKWTGTPRWDDCIAAADKLISSAAGGQNGAMELDPNITDQFKPDNHKSKEVLFAITYNTQTSNNAPPFPADFFYFDQKAIYGGTRDGNDGVVLVPGVYTTYNDDDLRKTEWLLEGPQYKYGTTDTPVQGRYEYANQPLVFVDNIRKNKEAEANGTDPENLVSNMLNGEENSGVRFNKYKLGVAPTVSAANGNPFYNSTDWNVYRLTWIYFAKAEALMRKNGNIANQDAVDLINTCKKRAFTDDTWPTHAYTIATLTLDELLAERGREFIFEGFRRQDLIRFGKFTTASWWDHAPTAITRELFAVPQRQRTLNPNLDQNDGYIK
ncbi:RagB/SusD family nutrient uptake outer membrane protein [Parachryseolinea silvisoli]|uniref:RagB/SusD family nutrient uptake outer membrane protein n=1 Tax=Parachryseolinea silvisoli TaxID=2873601 RepID=UPI002265F408|nr:RagB/SusD family nutrient uptake outer membrane protein [Parachryseolinea silvisoli]MCD9018915.1 RagB/SusD family nutrient uptake outer membrane protein [Parachryseolinea silvisoli]